MRRSSVLASTLAAAALAACSAANVGGTRFANQPPVWAVNDRAPLPHAPEDRIYNRTLYHLDGFLFRRVTRALDFPEPVRAQDVNSLDEVPDSTWFTNRIGVRDLTPDEVRRGANVDDSPALHLPWTITSAKVGGLSIGFVFQDARGDKYLMKFDSKEALEMETGAHVVLNRILWACGYNVPQDAVTYVRPSDIKVKEGAKRADTAGGKTPLTQADVDRALSTVWHAEDGTIRVLVSKYVAGPPIGPYARGGTRADDPNDMIPHEQRRSLRGQVALFAWLNHTDLQEDNTLDAFVTPDKGKDAGYVLHYLIDFGSALGTMGAQLHWQNVGYARRIDLGEIASSLFGVGLVKQPYEDVHAPKLRGLGLYEADSYQPGEWLPNSPYWPFFDADKYDAFWGAKLLIRFTKEQLAAVIAEAHYSDPRTAAYLLQTLIERQRKTARYWFQQVAPLDAFTVEADGAGAARVCFDDLTRRYRLEPATGARSYRVTARDWDDHALAVDQRVEATADGHACVAGIPAATSHDGYTIVRLVLSRGARVMAPVDLHLAKGADGALRIIGLRRL